MRSIHVKNILLEDGWQRDVRLQITNGIIQAIDFDVISDNDYEVDIAIPGLCNAHSHSFQRALSGLTEFKRLNENDNFWTWRAAMYRLVEQINPETLSAIAAQAYTEMVKNGYTSVIEFHYLHHQQGCHDLNNKLFHALAEAANIAGIRLIYVPILYQRGGFNDEKLSTQQEQFYLSIEDLVEHYQYAKAELPNPHSIAIGVHSLRAVSKIALQEIIEFSKTEGIPLHLHIAEQQKEVNDFYALNKLRPVEWLYENFNVNQNWCLVHATHLTDRELEFVAKSGAVTCLCPTTEANLGDGIFRLKDYLAYGGNFAIGSDSNISIDPFEEIRWMEYAQRLIHEERNISSFNNYGSGHYLFNKTLQGGALASGDSKVGFIREGAYADLVTLSSENPSLIGHTNKTLLDAIIFSNHNVLIDRVMINGQWVNADKSILENYKEALFSVMDYKLIP